MSGKIFVLSVAIAAGYTLGFRDARHNADNIAVRAVQVLRTTFGATPNDIDARMTQLEGKN